MNEWFEELQSYVRSLRAKNPLPSSKSFRAARHARYRINGGSIVSWLENHEPHFLEQRRFWKPEEDSPPTVFTSDITGLVAASEIFDPDVRGIVYLNEGQFNNWLRMNPDDEFLGHVHFWARWVDPPHKDFLEMAEQYPLPPGGKYWQHQEGTLWGPLAGRGGDHLWIWDGNEATLVEEAMIRWIS